MLDLLIDLGCIAFVLLTGLLCVGWAVQRWGGTTHFCMGWCFWRRRIAEVVAVLVGLWHLLYGVLKLAYLVVWMVTT